MTAAASVTSRGDDSKARRLTLSAYQRVSYGEARKPAEVPVGGPELGHAVEEANGSDPRFVNPRTRNATSLELIPQERPVPARLPDELDGRGLEPRLDLIYRRIGLEGGSKIRGCETTPKNS
jgi:hypothetical protein